jgi:hypothetical protein
MCSVVFLSLAGKTKGLFENDISKRGAQDFRPLSIVNG